MRPIIVDRCLSPRLAGYLQNMGNSVIYISDSRNDENIKSLANDIGAYILTADLGAKDHNIGFRDYPYALHERPDKKPKHVWRDIRILMENEESL